MIRRLLASVALVGLLFNGAAQAAYVGSAPLIVSNGGTGQTSFTAHGIILGNGTGGLGVTGTGTSGVPLIGQGGSADPIFGTAVVGGGGTGQTTLATNGVLVGEGTSGIHVVGTSSSADAVVLWGAAGADPTAASVGSCSTGTSALTYNTSTHAFGCNSLTPGTIPTIATATGASPITIAATNLLTTVVSMATPAPATINLPTAVQTAGWRECVKDGTTNWGTNNATIKSPTSGTIDGVAGATGIVANQAHQELCFISDTTNWFIE